MRLLQAHKILIAAALGLSAALIAWGVVHRAQAGAWTSIALGAIMLPAGAWYLRKLQRNPPIR